MAKKVTATKLAAMLAGQPPAGWAATHGAGYHDAYDQEWKAGQGGMSAGWRWARFERAADGVTAVVVLNIRTADGDKWERDGAFSGCVVEGHTLANGRTFTRVGIDCESCSLSDDTTRHCDDCGGDLAALLEKQFARCAKSVERSKTAVAVAGTPFTVQPAWFATAAAALKAGKVVTLTPGGFGTGYHISRRQQRFATRAASALETKLGVAPLWLTTFDCD